MSRPAQIGAVPFRRVDLEYATVVFTRRHGGVSSPPFDTLNLGRYTDDDPANVARNLEMARDALGLDRLWLLHQVHGANIRELTSANSPDPPPQGDGWISELRGEGLLITGADCPPLVLATPSRVAIVHCGWRPLAAGIVEHALRLIGDGPLRAAIGPGIGADHYEVGTEVAEALGADGRNHYANGRLDLAGIIAEKLARAKPDHVEVVGDCTYSDRERYFSHRRDGGATGRQAGIAWRA